MGGKHDILTENELSEFKLSPTISKALKKVHSQFPNLKPPEIKILDWGCGRGRSVAKLREQNYSAYGVEIDEKAILNGYKLLAERNLPPQKILRHVSRIIDFPKSTFHFIFSEQVFEHVEDLNFVISECSRVTMRHGIGMHQFPSSKEVWESHLLMPFVHWLPKTKIRKIYIALMLLLNLGPKHKWPEDENATFYEKVLVYYEYLNNHTFYRDNRKINSIFEKNGFQSAFSVSSKIYWKSLLTSRLYKNGFPDGATLFNVRKR